MKFRIPDMSCGGCVRSVTAAVKALDEQAVVNADLDTKLVDIASSQPSEAIIHALDEAGFPAEQAA